MKIQVDINAVLNEKDPAYATITALGVEKAVEKFKQNLMKAIAVESLDISIKTLEEPAEAK